MSNHAHAKPAAPKTASKRMAKVVVASALGFALVGAGGTLALWNSSTDANTGGTITTGDLQVTASAAQKWSDVTEPLAPVANLDLATYKLVPGATVKLKQDVNVIAHGDKMYAELNVKVPNSTTGSILAQSVATVTVFNASDAQVGTVTAPTTGLGDMDLTFKVPATSAVGEAYRVEVAVTLPASADDTTKLKAIELGDIQLSLAQTSTP